MRAKFPTFVALIISVLSLSSIVQASEDSQSILVSVGSLKSLTHDKWKRGVCEQVYALAQQITDHTPTITCREFNPRDVFGKDANHLKTLHDWHLQITQDPRSNLTVSVTNWKRKSEVDIKTVSWNVKYGDGKKRDEAFFKSLTNIIFYMDNLDALKAALLASGVQESEKVGFDVSKQSFYDKKSSQELPFNEALKTFSEEGERNRKYLRTGLELGAILSAGMAVYYKHLVYNRKDFDYTLWDGLYHKIVSGEAIRFDDNDKFANYGHVYAGMLYYQLARSNGFSSFESFLINFASSAIWEYIEFHEVFSINDQILTPVGGYIMGEVSHQVACALLQRDSVAAKALAYGLNPGLASAHLQDYFLASNKYASGPDCKKKRWLELSVFLGAGKTQKPFDPRASNMANVGIDTTVINIEDFAEEGNGSKLILDTALAKLNMSYGTGEGMGDLKVIAQIMYSAYRRKNLVKNSKNELQGFEFLIGPSLLSTWRDVGTAYTWNDFLSTTTADNEDFYGTVSVLGASAYLNGFYKGYNIQADLSFHGDFTMVKAYALTPLMVANNGDLSGEHSLIQKRGYSWGLGHTSLANIVISKNRFSLNYNLQSSKAHSYEDRHRFNGNNPTPFEEELRTHKLNLGFKVSKRITLGLEKEVLIRSGSAGDMEKTGRYHGTAGKLIFSF